MPGKEQTKLHIPYTIATVTLDDTDNPRRNDMTNAVVSLTPQYLQGSVIEINTIGANTKKLIKSIFKLRE